MRRQKVVAYLVARRSIVQIVQLECLRAGIWGRMDTWGRILTYKA